MIATLTLSAAEFAAKRRGAQEDFIAVLTPIVSDALQALIDGDEQWADDLIAAITDLYVLAYEDEGGTGMPDPSDLIETLREMLDKTTAESDVSNIAVALSIATLNAAAIQAAVDDEAELFIEWVTMHDDDVRLAHRETEGQQRPIGEPFDVDGTPMLFPGDMAAPIELWINCRCTVRPVLARDALTAAADISDSTVVVALPAADHVVHGLGDEPSHVTLLYLKKPDDLTRQALEDLTADIASNYNPFEADLAGTGVLGPDEAKVLLLEAYEFEVFRATLEQDEVVASTLREMDTHPHFIPHLTVTYDGDMPEILPDRIHFDRLAVWHGEEQTEYRLGDTVEDNDLTAAGGGKVPWFGILAPENIRSGDGRKFAENSLSHRPLPLPLTWQKISDDGHRGNVTVASIESIEMADGMMRASGWFLDTPEANEVVGLIAEFGRFGVSVDADDAQFEYDDESEDIVFTQARVSSACIVPIPAFAEAWVALGTWDSEGDNLAASAGAVEVEGDWSDIEQFADVAPGRTEDGPGWLTHPVDTDRLRDYWVRGPGAAKIAWGSPGDFDRCRANVAEYVKPQHINGYCANRHYDALGTWPGRNAHAAETLASNDEMAEAISMTASAGHRAPAEWFQNPNLTEPTPLTVTDDGRVFGHIAAWGTCHIGFGETCVTPPHSQTDYAYFATGEVALDNGARARVGQITIGGGHAAPRLGLKPTLAHYDSTSTAAADVCVGEDEFGIWCAGWVRPGVSDEMVTALRASAVSGDWRTVAGNLELVAALAVNVPGFGIPRPQVAASAEGQISLVASGILAPRDEKAAEAAANIDESRLADAIAARLISAQRNRERLASLAARVKGE